mgnify:CR=1 FL=1
MTATLPLRSFYVFRAFRVCFLPLHGAVHYFIGENSKEILLLRSTHMGGSMKNDCVRLMVMAVLPATLTTGCAATAIERRQAATREVRQDRVELVRDQAKVTDDRMDLDRLSDLVIRWDQLRASRAPAAQLAQVEEQIAAELRRDLAENAEQARQADAEVQRSEKELQRSRRELRRERTDGDRNAAQRREKNRERRDDRRDLQDDLRDSQQARALFDKKSKVAGELLALQKRMDAANARQDQHLRDQQRVLLEQYLALSQEELRLGVREIREDRQEAREDRR